MVKQQVISLKEVETALTTEPALLDILEKRWVTLHKDHGLSFIDELIQNVVYQFSTLPGKVIPVFSCQSHPERKDRRLYILFAVNLQGLLSLTKVHTESVRICQSFGMNWPNLVRSRLDSNHFDNKVDGWTGVIIEYRFRPREHTKKRINFVVQTLLEGIELAKSSVETIEQPSKI